jgi:uncharacterized membrane protein
MGTNRLESFSDGVIAVAITLLVLNIGVPGTDTHHSLVSDLGRQWPEYLAYVISFLTIGIIWANHHTVFGQIARVNRTFLMINVVFLMVVAFTPFSTKVLASSMRSGARAGGFEYGLTFTAMALCYAALWFYAAHNGRLLREDADPRTVSGISRSFRPGWALYALATASSFLSDYLATALFAAIAIFYVLESSVFGRDT